MASLLLCVLGVLFGYCSGGSTVSFCKNSKDGEWRSDLSHVLLGIPFTVEPVPCEGVGREEKAVSLKHSPSGLVEIVSQINGQSEDQYFATIISKISSSRITSVEYNLQETLDGVKEAVVAYVELNTKNHIAFQQAVLSTALPSDINVFQVTNKSLLPRENYRQVKKNLHVWIVTDNEWSHLVLPYRGMAPDEMMHYIAGIFSRLQFPLKVTYESPNSYNEYRQARFNIFVAYHRTDQIDEIHKTLINPLVNIFRPYFVFFTFDVDEHSVPRDVSSEGPFPYIVTYKEGQRSGVHLNREYTPYTVENLKSILESMMDPAVNNVEAPPPSGMYVTRTDIGALEAISQQDHKPALAVLCRIGTPDCDMMQEKLHKAVRAVERVQEHYEIMLFIVECENTDIVSLVEVPQLPYVIAKGEDGQWSLFSDNTALTVFVKGIQTHGRKTDSTEKEYHVSKDSPAKTQHDDYYDNFDELTEDDMFGIMFTDYLVIPPSLLPILTTENYTSFINQHENCLLAFYLPYCLSCKPMLYHLMNTTQQMKSAGMPTAIVNCANYPDVCETFSVYQYPTVRYRRGSNGDWTTYQGVLSNVELVKLALNKQEKEDKEQEKRIVDLTPSLLLKMLKSDALDTLLILSAEEVTPDLESTLSGVTDYQIYWLNSTRYSKLSEFLIGLNLLLPPVLIWADYVKHSLYRLDLKRPLPQEKVVSFISDIISGIKQPDAGITPTDWKPHSPPLVFPSGRYLSQEQENEALQEEAIHYGEPPPHYDSGHHGRNEYLGEPLHQEHIHHHEEL